MENSQIAIKRVTFTTGAPDFIYDVKSWVANGGWKGFLKDNCISILDVKKVENDYMSFDAFNSLDAWEG